MDELRFFEIYRNADYLALLAEGMGFSFGLTLGGAVFGLAFALLLSVTRHIRTPMLGLASAAYTDFIRNTPLIVQLFFVAFGLPLLLGYQWPFWGHALLALTLNFSAYFAEILRAGYRAVPSGQHEAARSLGLRPAHVFCLITLPQAIATMYPSLTSQFIFLFLTTGVVSEIGARDLTYAGVFIDSRTFRSFEVFLTLTALYMLMALSFKGLLTLLHRRLCPWLHIR
ncbi:MAG: amino acid ABC transporter permease [Pseudomonadota bacterium]